MKTIFTIVFVLMVSCNSFSQDLPNYMTDKEKEIYKNYVPPFTEVDFTTPPPTPVRTMAEWEELDGIMLTWTSYTPIIRQIVDYAQDEGLVYIVCSDSNNQQMPQELHHQEDGVCYISSQLISGCRKFRSKRTRRRSLCTRLNYKML